MKPTASREFPEFDSLLVEGRAARQEDLQWDVSGAMRVIWPGLGLSTSVQWGLLWDGSC
jgi:hypothetical protein